MKSQPQPQPQPQAVKPFENPGEENVAATRYVASLSHILSDMFLVDLNNNIGGDFDLETSHW